MPISCNIDPRGRTTRIVAGALLEGPGWLLLVLRFVDLLSGDWPWFVGGAAVLGGTILMLEGAFGWCVVRAAGLKTPI